MEEGRDEGRHSPPIGSHTASLVGKYIFIYGGDSTTEHLNNDICRLDTGTPSPVVLQTKQALTSSAQQNRLT